IGLKLALGRTPLPFSSDRIGPADADSDDQKPDGSAISIGITAPVFNVYVAVNGRWGTRHVAGVAFC
ncbi:MAG: hypothetical protein QGG53_25625, partial [Planctomycetota bacterium]|nr:hypothetical protein [Planctomycetota bacterium]